MSDNTVLCPEKGPITEELLERMNKWFRAANYLSAGQLYLLENPLLRKPLTLDMIKKKIVGHWGTVPGQNFVFVHLNRVIKRYDLDLILLSGPGHGGNFYIANDYLDGTYSEVYPNISEDEAGMATLFKQFSFPGGVPSHCAPETPGSINEGGELGYGIAHAFGAVFDNPGLIAAVTVGDGEAETGPLATSWQCNKFLNPINDGAVLPILHLNGYKIANPTIFARMSHQELVDFLFRIVDTEADPDHARRMCAFAVLESAYLIIRNTLQSPYVGLCTEGSAACTHSAIFLQGNCKIIGIQIRKVKCDYAHTVIDILRIP